MGGLSIAANWEYYEHLGCKVLGMLAWDVRYVVMCKGCLLSPAPTCAPARTEDKEGPSQPPFPPTPREMGGGEPGLRYPPFPSPGNGRKWEKVVRSSFRCKLR
jgi:hypothetical protein